MRAFMAQVADSGLTGGLIELAATLMDSLTTNPSRGLCATAAEGLLLLEPLLRGEAHLGVVHALTPPFHVMCCRSVCPPSRKRDANPCMQTACLVESSLVAAHCNKNQHVFLWGGILEFC